MSIKKGNTIKTSLVCCAVMSALSTNQVYSAEDGSNVEDGQIERITVTSRKRTEAIIEVPMSISTVSALEISDRNLVDKSDIYRTLAGASNPRGELILRGLSGSNDNTPGTTSTFIDGIPADSTSFYGFQPFGDLYDVERVEVLRGPQGTLYGSNAIGGTVRIITKKPQLDQFEVNASFQVNNQERTEGNELRGSAAINMPISDTTALRITGTVVDDPKPTTNVNTSVTGYDKSDLLRTQFLWEPEDDLRVTAAYVHEQVRTLGDSDSDTSIGFHSYYTPQLSANPDAPFGYDVSLGDPPDCNLSRVECFQDGPIIGADPKYARFEAMDEWREYEMDLISLNVEYDNLFGIGDLYYAGSYREEVTEGLQDWSRTDGQDMFRSWIIDDWSTDRVTHELRLQNSDTESKFDWIVGFFYDKESNGDGINKQFQYHGDGNEGKALASYLWGYYWGYLGFEYESVDGTTSQQIDNVAQLGEFYWNDPNINYEERSELYWTKEEALFGEISYTFGLGNLGELELTGGIRFYELSDKNRDVTIGIWNGAEPSKDESSGDEDGDRIKLSASWRPDDNRSVYALYSEGYRPGGNNLPVLPQSCRNDPNAKFHSTRYESDEIENYELGYKALMFDNRVSISTAVYQIDWEGVQAPIRMGCGFSFTANAATAETKGFELETRVQITDDLIMTLNYGYTDAEMTSDVESLQVEKGDKMTMVPDYNAYLAFDQGLIVFNRQAYIRADLSAYGEYDSYFKGTELDQIPSYEVVNISGRIEVNDNTKLSLHINNVFDEEIIDYKRAASSGYSGAQWVRYGKDRNLTLRIDFNF